MPPSLGRDGEQSPAETITGAFARQGVPVLAPACGETPYDLVVEVDGQFLRVAAVQAAGDGAVDASVARERRDAPGEYLSAVNYVAARSTDGVVHLLHATAFADGAVTPGPDDRLTARLPGPPP